jgi:uncharacterized membrane protein
MRKRRYLLLILIIALATILRFYDLTYQSLWGDEAFSIYAAKCVDMHFMTASLIDVTHRRFFNPHREATDILSACIQNEGAPPAYYLSLALWIKLFGGSDLAVRSLSALCGIVAVLLFYLLALRFSNATALIASLFIAVSPLNIYFSQEVRAYIFANALVICTSWLFLRALQAPRSGPRWIAYGISALILCHSFYFAAFILIAHLIYLTVYHRRLFKPWLLTVSIVGVLFIPWCVFGLKNQLAVTSGYASPGPSSAGEFRAAYLHAMRYILDSLLLGPMYCREIINARIKLIIEYGVLVLMLIGGIRLWMKKERKVVTFSLLIILVPFTVICLYGYLKGTLWYMKPRYHIWESTGVLLLAAASITTFRSTTVKSALISLFCLFSILAAPYHFYPKIHYSTHAKPDFRDVARIITEQQERGDLIIVNIAGHMIPLNIYYKGGLRQVGLAETGRYDLREKLKEYTAKRKRVWLLIGLDTVGHGDEEITDFLNTNFVPLHVWNKKGLRLTLYSNALDTRTSASNGDTVSE